MKKQRFFIEGGSIAERNMSGVGHTTLNLIKELARNKDFSQKYEIFVIVAFNKINLAAAHNLPRNVKFRKLYLPGKIMNGLSRFNALPYMDLFFGKGTYFFPNFKNWPLLLSKNVTYIHDVYFKVEPRHIEKRNLDLLERNTKTFIARADKVITVSWHAKQEIEHFFPESIGKVEVVYNGIDQTSFYPRSISEQTKVAKKYNLEPKKYFMFLSNIEPRKNVMNLLDAYKIFVDTTKQNDTALLLVGGMGWGNEAIVNKMQELRNQGYRVMKSEKYVPDTDIAPLLSGAIALVHPALYEGFGLPLLEAMACGVPVIVGNNSSIPEIMGPEFKKYTDTSSVGAIVAAMKSVDNNYQKQDIDYNLQRVPLFSWHKSAERLGRIIREL